MTQGIYKITNLINGKIYIGSSVKIEHRKNSHFCLLAKGKHDNKFLQKSYEKHGKENFNFEIVEIVGGSQKILLEREQFYLDQFYDNCKNCYNINPRADSPASIPMTEEKKLKNIERGKLNRGPNNPLYGKKRPADVVERAAAPNRGRKLTEEHKAKLAIAHTGLKLPPKTEEFKKMMRENMIGEKNHMFGKTGKAHHLSIQVQQFNLDGTFIAEYDSLIAADKATNVSFKTISSCINKKQKTGGGFIWKKNESK